MSCYKNFGSVHQHVACIAKDVASSVMGHWMCWFSVHPIVWVIAVTNPVIMGAIVL
jgi:hypothetical protein